MSGGAARRVNAPASAAASWGPGPPDPNMNVFVDTSALLALLDADDGHHREAVRAWDRLAEAEAALVTTNYVMLETIAVVQHRLGLDAVRTLVRVVAPLVQLVFVTATVHDAAMTALLAAGRRQLSLVDCASFEVMRQAHLDQAYAYDRHFTEQGFKLEG